MPGVLAAIFVFAGPASAGSLNGWGLATGPSNVAVMPFVSGDRDAGFAQVYGAAGLGQRADVNVGVGTQFDWLGGTQTTLELLPRVFVHDTLGVGAHLFWSAATQQVSGGPELHGEWRTGPFALGLNLGLVLESATAGAVGGTGWAVVAPELYLHDRLSLFCEVDPQVSVDLVTAGVAIVPGVSAAFGPDNAHAVSVGVGLGLDAAVTNVGVAWTSAWSTAQP